MIVIDWLAKFFSTHNEWYIQWCQPHPCLHQSLYISEKPHQLPFTDEVSILIISKMIQNTTWPYPHTKRSKVITMHSSIIWIMTHSDQAQTRGRWMQKQNAVKRTEHYRIIPQPTTNAETPIILNNENISPERCLVLIFPNESEDLTYWSTF